MENNDKKFILSKADLFVIFQATKIKIISYIIIMSSIVIGVTNARGFSGLVLWDILKVILLVLLLIEPLYFIHRKKFKKVPYKIIINISQKTINFIMCFTDNTKIFNFSDVKGIIDDPQYYIIFSNNRERFAWCKNKENNAELERLLNQTDIKIIQGRRSPFDYRLFWSKK